MTRRRLERRLNRLEEIQPPEPPAAKRDPVRLTAEQLRRMPTEELLARLETRFNDERGRALRDELRGLTDEELLARWSRRP